MLENLDPEGPYPLADLDRGSIFASGIGPGGR